MIGATTPRLDQGEVESAHPCGPTPAPSLRSPDSARRREHSPSSDSPRAPPARSAQGVGLGVGLPASARAACLPARRRGARARAGPTPRTGTGGARARRRLPERPVLIRRRRRTRGPARDPGPQGAGRKGRAVGEAVRGRRGKGGDRFPRSAKPGLPPKANPTPVVISD